MRDIEVKPRDLFSRVSRHVDRDRGLPISTGAISLAAQCRLGGAPLPVEVARILRRRVGKKLRLGWGMTETCRGTCAPDADRNKPRPSVPFRPSWVLGRSTNVLRPARSARSASRADVTKGYWQAEGDRESLSGPLLTGRHRLCRRGRLLLPGPDRKKDMIISGGFNVYPQISSRRSTDATERARSDRDRHPRRLSRRGERPSSRCPRPRRALDRRTRTFLTGKLGKHELPWRSNSQRNCRAAGRKALPTNWQSHLPLEEKIA